MWQLGVVLISSPTGIRQALVQDKGGRVDEMPGAVLGSIAESTHQSLSGVPSPLSPAPSVSPSPPSTRPPQSQLASPRGAPLRGGATQQTLNAEVERKRRFILHVSILKQLLKEQRCSEDQLLQALRNATFVDGEYIYCQGQVERDLYFIEEGKVLITQRRAPSGSAGTQLSALTTPKTPSRRRSVQEEEMEEQVDTLREYEYFGELALLQNKPTRKYNAVASGAVSCFVLLEHDYAVLLQPLHALLLYRHLLRAHCVLEKDRMFKDFNPVQRKFLIERCHLEAFTDGELICRQGEQDDRYFILAEGEAHVVVEEGGVTTVVANKSIFLSFGEMGLLDKPRTASVVAVGTSVLCIVISRKQYISAAQLSGTASTLDVDAEALLATTLIEEWKLAINARNLHLSNPQVAHYLVTFIKKFKAAYNQKFAGRTLYLDLFRRLHQEPSLAEEFEFLASRIAWDSPSSSLGIIRSETRRVLSKQPADRSADETSFIGRLIEHTALLSKFDVPGPHIDRYKLARCLAKVVMFANISKDAYLFRQGKIESRAFLILRGKINIVNEDVSVANSVIKHHEVLATLSAGDSFGELSLVTRLQRSATTVAGCDTDLLVFDREHLLHVQSALPGVSVQQVMVQRAEFLSRLSFFKGSDFGQCIRVAHDLQEAVYDARHLFMQDAAQQRTLFIVKSGEVAVFMKTQMPVESASAGTCQPLPPTKPALVRVATIGAQEFFGVAIASINMGSTALPPSLSSSSLSLPALTMSAAPACDLGAAVYMCTSRVVVLELSERGWRRLSPQNLLIIRNALIERHKWNESVTRQVTGSGHYYHVDRPWQQLKGCSSPRRCSTSAVPSLGAPQGCIAPRTGSHLARHLIEKKTHKSAYAALFSQDPPGSDNIKQVKPLQAFDSRGAGPPLSNATASRKVLGWDSVLSPPNALCSSRPEPSATSLSPLITFASWTSPSPSLLPPSLPPRAGPLSILNFKKERLASNTSIAREKATAAEDSASLWKARWSPTRRVEHEAP